MDSDLMPGPVDRPACSPFTNRLGVRPAGTGLRLDRVIVVSVPTPWPKPAVGHPWIKAGAAALARSPVPSRVLVAEPWTVDTVVELYERSGVAFKSYRWVCTSPHDIDDIIASIAAAPIGGHGMAPIDVTVPTFLLCTQGTHDFCCGDFGEALASSVESERPGWRLRRVSHIGGHRFAPTLLALPGGRMWAWADLGLLDRISVGAETEDDLRRRCRGWTGVAPGVAQVAEIAARLQAGNDFFEEPVVTVGDSGDDGVQVRVESGYHAWAVEVHEARQVPAIACGVPGGLPVKQAIEYDWEARPAPSGEGQGQI